VREINHLAHMLANLAGIKDFGDNKASGSDLRCQTQTAHNMVPCTKIAKKPTTYMDVFMDDFCILWSRARLMHDLLVIQHHALMHNIDKVFWPKDENDNMSIVRHPFPLSNSKKGMVLPSKTKRNALPAGTTGGSQKTRM
jgi:hypothetical protein